MLFQSDTAFSSIVSGFLFGLLILACASPVSGQNSTPKRVALLVGNSKYDDQPLRNPANDILAIEEVLKPLQFDVTLRSDRSRQPKLHGADRGQVRKRTSCETPLRQPPLLDRRNGGIRWQPKRRGVRCLSQQSVSVLLAQCKEGSKSDSRCPTGDDRIFCGALRASHAGWRW